MNTPITLCRCGSIPSVIHHDGGVQIQCGTCRISGGWISEQSLPPQTALDKAVTSWNNLMRQNIEEYGREDVI